MEKELTIQIIIICSTTLAGTITRIVIEWQKSRILLKRALLIIMSSAITGYINFELAHILDWNKWLGVVSVLTSIIAVDLILIFKKDSPNLIKKKVLDYFNLEQKTNNHESSSSDRTPREK